MSDPANSLAGEWHEEFTAGFQARLAQKFREMDNVPLSILVWGPGPHSPEYTKREQIINHLSQVNPANEVRTSEQMDAIEPRLSELHLYESEELQVEVADLIFALIPKERGPTGVPAEVARYWDNEVFRGKTYLIVPRLNRDDRRRGFLDQGWVMWPHERRFTYTQRQYEDCTKIRSYCSDVIKELRKTRYFRELRRNRLGPA